MPSVKCKCGRFTYNLSGRCVKCIRKAPNRCKCGTQLKNKLNRVCAACRIEARECRVKPEDIDALVERQRANLPKWWNGAAERQAARDREQQQAKPWTVPVVSLRVGGRVVKKMGGRRQ